MLTSSRTYALWNAIKRSTPGVKSYAEDEDKHSQQTMFTACDGIREHAASILAEEPSCTRPPRCL